MTAGHVAGLGLEQVPAEALQLELRPRVFAGAMAFLCASHRDVGAHERARYALALRSGSAPPLSSEGGVTQISSGTAPSSPQTLTWRYAAHRVVVLVDVRRSTRDWVDGVVGALDGVLSALTSGPLDGAPPPTLHVSVVLGARLGAEIVAVGSAAWKLEKLGA